MIARLSDLLRHSLASSGTQEVTLREELGLLERYVDIERVRFADRLTVTTTAPEETLEALVPNLILQPIVENAIRHGVASRSVPGLVQIVALRAGDDLLLRVFDDGPGMSAAGASHDGNGVGLQNTRARLTQLYGSGERLLVEGRAEGGTAITLRMPFRVAASAGSALPCAEDVIADDAALSERVPLSSSS
jgi:two-component system LytT family sensor kinase